MSADEADGTLLCELDALSVAERGGSSEGGGAGGGDALVQQSGGGDTLGIVLDLHYLQLAASAYSLQTRWEVCRRRPRAPDTDRTHARCGGVRARPA